MKMKKAIRIMMLVCVIITIALTVFTGCSKDKGGDTNIEVTLTPTDSNTVIDTEQSEAELKAQFVSACKYASAENMNEKREKYENEKLDISFYVNGIFEPTNLESIKDDQYYVGYPLQEGTFRYDIADQWFVLDTKDYDIPENLTDELVRVYGTYLGEKEVAYMTNVERQVYLTKDGERLEVDEKGIIISITEERIAKANTDISTTLKETTQEELITITERTTKILENTEDTKEDSFSKIINDLKAIIDNKDTKEEVKKAAEKLVKNIEELVLCQKGNTENISSKKDITVVLETNLEEVKESVPFISIAYLDIVDGKPEISDSTIKVSKEDLIGKMFPWMNPKASQNNNQNNQSGEKTGENENAGNGEVIDGSNNTGNGAIITPSPAPAPEIVQGTKSGGNGVSSGSPSGSSGSTGGSESKINEPGGTTQNALTLDGDKAVVTDKASGKATVYYKNKNRTVDILIGGYALKGDNARQGLIRGKNANSLLRDFDYNFADDLEAGNELAILHFTVKIKDTDAGYGSDCIPDIRIRSSKGTLIDNTITPYYIVTLDEKGKKYGNNSSYIKEYDLVFQLPKGINGVQVWFGRAQGEVYKWAYKGGTVEGLIK